MKLVVPRGIPRTLLILLGKVVAKRLGFSSDSGLTLGDLSVLTGLKGDELNKVIDASPYLVYSGHGRYRLNTLFLSALLEELEKLYTSEEQESM